MVFQTLALSLAALLALALSACGTPASGTGTSAGTDAAATASAGQAPSAETGTATLQEEQAPDQTVTTVSLSAVGDNLIHMPVVTTADGYAGGMGDGWYDFTPMYAGVMDILATHDLNFIDQETILGGDYLGFSGYPTFNSPSCIAEQVASCGWNLVTTATNHALDMGLEGVDNSCATWAAQPSVTMAGTYTSWEDRSTIRMREVNGITFAFLAYADDLNGYTLSPDSAYAVATTDDAAMTIDVQRAREQGADVVIVAMSWGSEDSTSPNEIQTYYAQHLANLGVDLVLGFGPHAIEPIETYDALDANGNKTGHQTLVVFSLGNFLSNQPKAIECVEGCFSCVFTRVGSGPVTITDTCWTPLINQVDADFHQVYKLKDYTYDLAYAHDSLGLESDPIGYARDLTTSVIGPSGVYIDM